MRRWGIRARVMLVALAPAVAIVLLLGIYFTQVRFADHERALRDAGLAMARQLALAAEYGVFSGNREVLAGLVAAIMREPGATGVFILDREGRVLASGGRAIPVSAHAVFGRMTAQTDDDNGRVLITSAPIFQSQLALEEFFDSGAPGASGSPASATVLGRTAVALSKASLIEQRDRLILDSLLITFAVLVGATVLALRMSRDVTRPVINLTHTVEKLAHGDLRARVEPDAAGAIRGLESGINAMADALKAATEDMERRVVEATAGLKEKTQEAEAANQAKSRFVAAASHDLRQPLHAIGLYVEALRARADNAETRYVVGQIAIAVAGLQDLLDALLNISRLDAGSVQPRIVDFPIQRLLVTMQAQYAQAACAKGLTFRTVASGARVRGDPLLVERILSNLVSNAVRYTRRGKILLGCRRRAGALRIEVWDTGIGIPTGQQRLIFEEFYRGAVPDEAEKGFGLGLAIVERLARLLGYSLELRSSEGKGSVFVVTAPLAESASVAHESVGPALAPASLRGAVVLVVDDDAQALSATRTLLEGWGCQVWTAASGAEARARLTPEGAARVDVIISDYRMPGETGVQMLERLRTTHVPNLQGILVTADTSNEALQAAQEYGYPLLQKPVRPAKLRALLQHHLRNRTPAGVEPS